MALRANVCQFTFICHRRFDHLNMKSLRQLQEEEMVFRLSEIKLTNEICERCAFGKQSRDAFLKEASWRPTFLWNLFTLMYMGLYKHLQRLETYTSSPLSSPL